ncbi:MAG: SufD family Fe-S cluster assembly protein [Lachnospiraceae bacterium]|nr:SufD family Fe-S cluster assembly protein [Lachnospiraceae bacterium]
MEKVTKVNPLPVLTWNKLKLNDAQLAVDGLTAYDAPALEPIKLLGEWDAEELAVWYKKEGIEYIPEAIVAGKYPMAGGQIFPGGSGAGVEELLKSAGAKTRVYELKGNGLKVRLDSIHDEGASVIESVLFVLRAGSDAELIRYVSGSGSSGFEGLHLRLVLEKGAKLHYTLLQMLKKDVTFLFDAGARLDEGAELTYSCLQLGSRKVYEGAYFDQIGDGCRLRSDLAYLGLKDSFFDYNYVDCFRGKKTEGVMRFHGVLCDNAQKVSRETLDFRQHCGEAIGDEEEDVLVMGPDIVNKAMPMILGEEEDVSGRHAVTIGRLSSDLLFYMQSRGISEALACELLLRSRILRVAARIPDEDLRGAVEAYLEQITF